MDSKNQNLDPAQPQDPLINPATPTPQTTSGFGGTKIIQPLPPEPPGNNPAAPANVDSVGSGIQPQPSATMGPQPSPPITARPAPSSIYPEPQTGFFGSQASSVTKSSIEDEEKRTKKRKKLIITVISLVVIILAAAGVFSYWYLQQDHSIYAKLDTYNYSQDGISISFKYPSILSPDSSGLAKIQKDNPSSTATYYRVLAYKPSTKQAVVMIVSTVQIGQLYNQLNITPSQYLIQIKNGSGSWIDLLKQKDPQTYQSIYNGCNNMIKNDQSQQLVYCYQSNGGESIIKLIGADTNNEYDLILAVPNSVWSMHPKVWQKIEKSFIYNS